MTNVEKQLSKHKSDTGAIRDRFFETGDASSVLESRSELVDGTVSSAYRDHLVTVYPQGLAVVAVGGFGRRELYPCSDVDVLLLTRKEPSGKNLEALSAFLRVLWDSGLRLSHSVRTPKECLELHDENIELNISLLDQRYLVGDRELYEELAGRLPRFMRGQRQSLIRRLSKLTLSRHAKYQDTIYHLEPNIKETPGGLRDLHLLWWLGKLGDKTPAASGGMEDLKRASDSLSSLRCYLHYRAGRDDNSLSFDAQEEITEQAFLPYDDPEKWMREYFLHARTIYRAASRAMDSSQARYSSLLKEFRNRRSRLSNSDFTVSHDRVFFKTPHNIAHDPELVMHLFQFIGRFGMLLAPESERRISEHLPQIERYYARQAPHWVRLLETLSLPRPSKALAAMHETGVLSAILPEWKRVECLVVRDFYHLYTVDEHTLRTISALENLQNSTDSVRQRFAELLTEIEQPEVLRLALLLHDIGKGEGKGKHVERSVELAEQAMDRIQLPIREQLMVNFLIDRHLDLYKVMTGRDLDDPSTRKYLAQRIETVEKLKNLTLMTYADISAVNPSAMSPWRLDQLWRVYVATYNELTRELDTDRFAAHSAISPDHSAFLEGFPARYLHTHSSEEIDKHLELERSSRKRGVAVKLEKRNGVYQLIIVSKDRPFLLASITGALAGFGMNIQKAEAFSNRHGTAFDTFIFEDPRHTLELNPTEADRLRLTLERVTLSKLRARDLLKNRPIPAPPSKRRRIQPRIVFNGTASETSTLIEIIAEDRPGLLYELTRALSETGCNIELVLIDTEAHKAIDVFYVTLDGKKLVPEMETSLKQILLEIASPHKSGAK